MNILALNDTKSSSTFETRKKAINAIIKLGWSYIKTCGYYHTSRTSVYRWVKKYKNNPCDESIALLSHKPKTVHPNAYNSESIQRILNKHKRCPEKTKFEIWCEFQVSNDQFKPSYMTILRAFRRNNADFYTKQTKRKSMINLMIRLKYQAKSGRLMLNTYQKQWQQKPKLTNGV